VVARDLINFEVKKMDEDVWDPFEEDEEEEFMFE
jgi:hypothetical protein